MNDAFGDRGAEPGHALGQPRRHAAAVQRQIGDSGALHTLIFAANRHRHFLMH